MDELLEQLTEKLGINKDVARKVILVVANYLKHKLPESVAGEIDLALDMKDVTEEEMRDVGLFKFP